MQQSLDDRHLSPQTKVLFCMQKYLFCAQEVEMDVFTLHFFFLVLYVLVVRVSSLCTCIL